jgi:hypothetical protein
MVNLDLEKAQIIFKLNRKENWGAKYDRLEHFKRFPNLDKCVKELLKEGWIIIKQKPQYTGMSLDTKHKREIIEFIGEQMPQYRDSLN